LEERVLIDHNLKIDFDKMNQLQDRSKYFTRLFDAMTYQPLLSLITYEDIIALHMLFNDPDFCDKPRSQQLELADSIMKPRGFTRIHSGTNRIVYGSSDHPTIVLKVATDAQGISDNDDEVYNQDFLKPYVPKVYEVSECGTVQLVERVQPIKNRQEFWDNRYQIFHILYSFTHIKKYLVEDLGSAFFMNWGLRKGFGPVILDYPYVYKYIPSRSRCIAVDEVTGKMCNGMIWYDDAMNTIVCHKCGKRYSAKDIGAKLKKRQVSDKEILEMFSANLESDNLFDNVIIHGYSNKDAALRIKPDEAETIKKTEVEPKLKAPENKVPKFKKSCKIAKDF
jgi:hypothetical protein